MVVRTAERAPELSIRHVLAFLLTSHRPLLWSLLRPSRTHHVLDSEGNVLSGCPAQMLATEITVCAHCTLTTAFSVVSPRFGTGIEQGICMPPRTMDGLMCAGQ